MARIRTIKPEFPQSESMGKVSRDARLLFIQMWTLADDSGRLRGNSRMLASLLFPYDEDARGLISGWIEELIEEKCIVCYQGADGSSYVAISHWSDHQKIDKPSKSKLPEPPSRILANSLVSSEKVREPSSEDQGSRIKEGTKDQGEDCLKNSLFEIEGFEDVWGMWKLHRIEKHKPVGSIEEEVQLMELARFGKEAKSVVEFSIRNGALNLIFNGQHPKSEPLKNKGNPQAVVMCAELMAHTGGNFVPNYDYDKHVDGDGNIIPFGGAA